MLSRAKTVIFTLLIIVIFGGILYFIWSVIANFFAFLSETNVNVAAAIIAGSATVLTGIVAVILGQFFARGREIAEAHRAKKTEIYAGFLQQMIHFLRKLIDDDSFDPQQNPEMEEFFFNFKRDVLLWASPKVVRVWLEFQNSDGETHGGQTLIAMDNLIRAMRSDLGLRNGLLSKGALIKVLLSDPQELDAMIKS